MRWYNPIRCPTTRISPSGLQCRQSGSRSMSASGRSILLLLSILGFAGRSQHRQFELLLVGDFAELVDAAGLDLADPFLGDTQFPAQLLEGSFGGSAQAEPAGDDQPFAVVEPVEHALDGFLHALEGAFIFVLVGAVVGRGLEHLLMAGDETVAPVVLLGNRPREVLHDRPRGVGAELVTPRKVELFDGAACRLAIETTSRRFDLMTWFLTARASS